ncbi:MAG: hypothetical protein HGGPFJEG_00494 [Ignavibacteria bacterium]|nr:hypothetical protein [Ignavibacteria bacterium]
MNFKNHYNKSDYISFFRDHFLPNDYSEEDEILSLEFTPSHIKEVTLIGKVESLELKIYEAKHSSEYDPRVSLSKDIFRIMRNYSSKKAIILFISDNSPNYRLSLATINFSLENTKVKKEYSNPRRYSFFLGPDSKTHTPEEFLIKKGRVKDFEDLNSRFSVEVVNKEFYREIALKFTELVGGERKIKSKVEKFKPLMQLPSTDNHQKMQEFTVRMIGRIVFCWFLKKKKSQKGISLIPEDILSKEAVNGNNDYYHSVLEKLFFEVMNKKKDDRIKFKNYELYENIPFLNGGLFEPHGDDYYDSKPLYSLVIPDKWLSEFFEILETYNFTIDENTSVDIDLSVDPEMLGRIFENLLAEINPETGETARKSTGSYYTPRPIVDYMVDESLKQYLITKTDMEEKKLSSLLLYSEEVIEITKDEAERIVDALDDIKILDPACGSGAFPIGILQKMLLILQKIDPDSERWLEKKLDKIDNPVLKKEIKLKFKNDNLDYIRKLGLIQDSIYGVDIQSIAVEISKLRCFLTLVVDENVDDKKENRGIVALPNLEFKFVASNTLIGLPESEGSLFDESDYMNKLEELRDEYFTSSGKRKLEIENEFLQTQEKMARQLAKNRITSGRAIELANWNPFSYESAKWFDPKWMFGLNEGFDIVIGNPPYVRQEKLDKNYKAILNSIHKEVANGTADLYVYFFSQALRIVSNMGCIIFITLNKYLKTKYGLELRNLLKDKYFVDLIVDFFELPVFEAATDSSITKIINDKLKRETRYFPIKRLEEFTNENFQKGNSRIVQMNENDWSFIDSKAKSLLKKTYNNTITLNNFVNGKIYRGITTGFNEAFILSESDSIKLRKSESKEFIKPYAKSVDIKKWNLLDYNKFFLATGYDLNIKSKFPTAFNFLSQFENELKARQDKGKHWWNLRACKYYDEFLKPKLIYMHTAKKHEFFLDYEKRYINNSCYMIISENKFLFCFLNSKLFDWFKKIKFVAYGDAEDTGRVKLDYNKMINVPIKRITQKEEYLFSIKVNNIITKRKLGHNFTDLDNQIDIMVYKLYELTYDEVKIVDPEIEKIISRESYEKFELK